jgi:hypothetical protein
MKLWTLISFSNKTYCEHARVIIYNLQKDISNNVLHVLIKDDFTPT